MIEEENFESMEKRGAESDFLSFMIDSLNEWIDERNGLWQWSIIKPVASWLNNGLATFGSGLQQDFLLQNDIARKLHALMQQYTLIIYSNITC